MSFFLNKVRTAYENAYSEIMSPKPYILPKIYHGGEKFDLSKRWYVYYSYLDSDTGIMKRQTPITLSINRRFKTKEERLHHLTLVQEIVGNLLKRGFSPEKIKLKSDKYTAEKCIDYAWKIKKEEIKNEIDKQLNI